MLTGAAIAAVSLALFLFWLPSGTAHARSLALAALLSGALALVFAERALESGLRAAGIPRTARFWIIWGGVALSLPVLIGVPSLAALLQLQALSVGEWALSIAAGVAAVALRLVRRP